MQRRYQAADAVTESECLVTHQYQIQPIETRIH